jgi:phosphopantothenoylcysteine decarboxylase/phosphopantothenate--cysteine ligase
MHPIEDIRGSKSSKLSGTRIVMGITGSIAAVECVKLARELARHGAEVIPVMSGASTKIVHPDSIHFATGHKVILELDGAVKHVELCGQSKSRADVLLIAPATANTISKIAYGIDDTVVTTMASCALGSGMPTIVVPAMHSSMYTHKIVTDNINKLKKLGVTFIGPRMEENKAKMAFLDDVVWGIMRVAGPRDFAGKSVLIISGPTKEPIDKVRHIANYSTGKTGIELGLEAYRRGADVEVWASANIEVPEFLNHKKFTSVTDLTKMARTTKADVIMVPAAISDFVVKPKKGKFSSEDTPTLKLNHAPKILDVLRKNKTAVIVGFKAETGIGKAELEKRARKRMTVSGIDLIVANLLEDVKENHTTALLLEPGKKTKNFKGSKAGLAEIIIDTVLRV